MRAGRDAAASVQIECPAHQTCLPSRLTATETALSSAVPSAQAPPVPVSLNAAGGARELGQGSGRLVPGEDRDGIAEERRDVQTTDPARLPGDTDRRQTEYSTAGRK